MAVADVPPAPAVTNAPEPDSVPEVDVDYGESEGEEDSPEPAHEAPKQEPVKKAEVETAAPKSAAAEAPPSKEPPAQKKKEAPSGDHTQPRAPLFAAALSKIKRLEQREPASKDTEMPEGPTRKRPAEATEEAPPATKPVPDRPEKAAKLDASTSAAVAKPSSQQPAKAEVPAKAAALQGGGPASRALRVDGFVRPFTLNQARDLLSQSGTVLAMWMPNIKNLAYVVFATVAQAEAAHAALAGLQWPANSPSKLQPRYVTVAEAELAIGEGAGNPDFKIGRTDEDGPDDVAAGAAPAAKDTPAKGAAENPPEAVNNARAPAKEALDARKEDVEGVTDLRELLKRRQGAVAPPEAHPVAQQPQNGAGDNEPLSLDDLFRRTQAKPAIYWLPVSEEEIQRRERSKIVPAAPEEKGMQPNTAAS